MKEKTISGKQLSAIVIVINISNCMVLGFPSGAGADTWLSLLLSLVLSIPLMMIYARLIHLMPGQNLLGMMRKTLGGPISTFFLTAYIFYFVIVAAADCGCNCEFLKLSALIKTPAVVISISFFILSVYLAKKGTQVIGKWCEIALTLGMSVILLLGVLSIPRLDPDFLLPIGKSGADKIIHSALLMIPLPVGETIVVLSLTDKLDKKANPYKSLCFGVIISTLILALVFLQNCCIMGEYLIENSYFPAYKAASLVHAGKIGTRFEALFASVFILCGISKIAINTLAAAKSASGLLKTEKTDRFILPVGVVCLAVSVLTFKNMTDITAMTDKYKYYAPVFQVALPLILWIAAEIRAWGKKTTVKVWKKTPPKAAAE